MILSLIRANLGSQAGSYIGGNSVTSQQNENADQMQLKVNELWKMTMKIDELQRDLDMKTGAVDRKFKSLSRAFCFGECVKSNSKGLANFLEIRSSFQNSNKKRSFDFSHEKLQIFLWKTFSLQSHSSRRLIH